MPKPVIFFTNVRLLYQNLNLSQILDILNKYIDCITNLSKIKMAAKF